MLFNSTVFIVLFMPLTVAAYYAAARSRSSRLNVLAFASVVFYAWWDWRFVPLLAGSIVANWLLARWFARRGRGAVVTTGIVFNLVLLGIFKYANFFADTFAFIAQAHSPGFDIVLPLGISFFTFQQITYLADARNGKAPQYGFRDYFLYVTFFPQLIAGPIVRHDELIPQLALDPRRPGMWERLMRGSVLFWIGAAKKVLIADECAALADPLFTEAFAGGALGLAESWLAAVTFSLQIYFDFSGYSDMAIGLGLMCGFTLPLNFDAPYRACNIRDQWRRWHMTLTRFIRDYLYIPLGGNRGSRLRTAFNAVATMALAGLWHGAAWKFVVWGTAHGVGIMIHVLWARLERPMPKPLGWLLTMLFWIITFVLFRAETFDSALAILAAMAGGNGASIALGSVPWIVLIGGVIATVGPTSQVAALERLHPRRTLGVLLAVAAVIILIVIGGELDNEFIYFQF